jgi:hypothetical protein
MEIESRRADLIARLWLFEKEKTVSAEMIRNLNLSSGATGPVSDQQAITRGRRRLFRAASCLLPAGTSRPKKAQVLATFEILALL